MLSRWRLRAQLMAILALVAVAPTVLLGALAIRNARRDVRDEVIRGNLALIRAIGHQLNTTLQDTRRALLVAATTWAQLPAVVDAASPAPRDDQPSRHVMQRLRDEFSLLRSVALLDREGRPISGDHGVDLPLDLANSYGGYVSEVLFGPAGRREVVMAVQARDRRGGLIGFLAAVVDLTFVRERLSDTRLGPGASLLVVDGNGRLVASATSRGSGLPATRRPAPAGHASLRDSHPAVDRVLGTHTEGEVEFVDADGREWIAVFRNIAGMSEFRAVRWGVVLSQPRDEAFALARKTTRDTLAVAAVVLLLALGIGAWTARRVTRPLHRLVEQTDRVAAGELEASADPAAGSAEVGLLSARFSQMVDRLRSGRERLYAQTEFRRNLVQSIPLGVISVDRQGVIQSINPAQERLSELAAAAAVGRRLAEVFDRVQADPPLVDGETGGLLQRLEQILAGERQAVDLTIDSRATPFTPAPCPRYRVRISPLRDREGKVDGAVIIQEDLSERARLEQQLIRSEKLSSVGMLAAGVAHEINNPLTTILGYAKLLLETTAANDPNRGALELVADEATRVQQIVRALLDFSRPERGETREVSLNALVERTLTLASLDLRQRGVEVQRELDEELPRILVDEQRVEQVFVNLVANAAQAMERGGTLTLRTGSDTQWVWADFVDEGAGISLADLSRVFDPFFTTKGPVEGTGLGLSVSHQIVTSHGGTIEVDSAPGRGSTFRVRLPRQQ